MLLENGQYPASRFRVIVVKTHEMSFYPMSSPLLSDTGTRDNNHPTLCRL